MLSLLAFIVASVSAQTTPQDEVRPAVRYNEVQQHTIHNAYAKQESLYSQLNDSRVRSLEIDIHNDHYRKVVPARDFAVYHFDFPFFDRTNCFLLSQCLEEIARFHREQPTHAPITLFIDLKDAFNAVHNARSLDAQLRAQLGEALFSPRELTQQCADASNVKESVARCGWPTIDALRGRVLVVATGGDLCVQHGKRGPLGQYHRVSDAAMFVAPRAARCEENKAAVFANLSEDELWQKPFNAVARVYRSALRGGFNDAKSFAQALQARAQFVATDKLDGDVLSWLARASVTPKTVATVSTSP